MSVEAIECLEAPWRDGRPSIHGLVVEALAVRGATAEALRVEPLREEAREMRWADGALDNLIGRKDDSPRQTKARRLVSAIGKTLRHPSGGSAAHLYELLRSGDLISIIDETLSLLVDEFADRRAALAALARRLVLEAPDVEPVKAGVALLGVSGTPDDAVLVSTIGQYEEITLYSVVALTKLLTDPEPAIWDLAKHVYGWGRIRAVGRLAGTHNPGIRDWMLRDGFRNRIMYEYLAYTCATSGGLLDAIRRDEVDEGLLIAAGEILSALVIGEPGKGIEEYADGPAVCIAYLRHMAAKPVRHLRAIDAVLDIQKLCEEERSGRLHGRPGWGAQVFLDVRSLANAVLRSPDVKATVEAGLASDAVFSFNLAAAIAPSFGIDAWPLRLERQRSCRSGQWYWLMQTDDAARIDQILALAREQLNFDLIGSGPTIGLGLGPEFADDKALEYVLQDLRRFPGKGWDLIKAGLRSRTIRARNMAMNALRGWGRGSWPSDAEECLRLAAEGEPDKKVRQRMRDFLDGRLGD